MRLVPNTVSRTIVRTRHQLFYGWVVVAAGFWVDFLSYGIVTVALGVLFPVLSDRLGTGRGLLSGALLLHASLVAVVTPFLGPVVDRRGPRALLATGALLLGLGTAALALVHTPWHFYAVYGVVMALGYAGLSDPVNHATVSQWFVKKRGRALGFVTMGFSVAGIVLPLSLTAALAVAGWRSTCIALGLVTCVTGLLAARLMHHRPESRGLLPDGDERVPGASTAALPDEAADGDARAAIRTPTFWLLLLGANAAGLALFGINLHLVSYLHDQGLSLTTAAFLVTVLYLCQTLAKPLWGFTAERLPVRVCLLLCYLGGAAGVLLLLLGRSVPTVLPFVLVYGLRTHPRCAVALGLAGVGGVFRPGHSGTGAQPGRTVPDCLDGRRSHPCRRAVRHNRRLYHRLPGVRRHVRDRGRAEFCRPTARPTRGPSVAACLADGHT
jgi:MFS family permease